MRADGEDDAIFEVIMDISGPCAWMPTPPEMDDLYPLHGLRVCLSQFTHFAGPIPQPEEGEGL